MNPQMPPLLTFNRYYYAMEAMDLAQRAGRGETPWSQDTTEAPLCAGRNSPSIEPRGLRRAAAVMAVLALVGGLVVMRSMV